MNIYRHVWQIVWNKVRSRYAPIESTNQRHKNQFEPVKFSELVDNIDPELGNFSAQIMVVSRKNQIIILTGREISNHPARHLLHSSSAEVIVAAVLSGELQEASRLTQMAGNWQAVPVHGLLGAIRRYPDEAKAWLEWSTELPTSSGSDYFAQLDMILSDLGLLDFYAQAARVSGTRSIVPFDAPTQLLPCNRRLLASAPLSS